MEIVIIAMTSKSSGDILLTDIRILKEIWNPTICDNRIHKVLTDQEVNKRLDIMELKAVLGCQITKFNIW